MFQSSITRVSRAMAGADALAVLERDSAPFAAGEVPSAPGGADTDRPRLSGFGMRFVGFFVGKFGLPDIESANEFSGLGAICRVL
jgi:hypothetical protein